MIYLKKHPALNSKTGKNLIENINTNWKHFSKYIHADAPSYFQTNLLSTKTKTISTKDFGIWKSIFLRPDIPLTIITALLQRAFILIPDSK